MGNLLELILERTIDLLAPMSVEVGPNGGIGVDVFPSVGVGDHGTVALKNQDGLALGPLLHLSERMPNMAQIKFRKRIHESKSMPAVKGSQWLSRA